MRHARWVRPWLLVAGLAIALPNASWAQQQVRVASYNIRFLSTAVTTQGDRLQKLRELIDLRDADVIGLQRSTTVPPSNCCSRQPTGRSSSTTTVVRIRTSRSPSDDRLRCAAFDATLDADNEHFLFPSAQDNLFFPNRRDVLFAEIQVPNTSATFFVLVIHAKSRLEGRATTDFRREEAARMLIQTLEQRFHERDFILLGDFNDNPDD